MSSTIMSSTTMSSTIEPLVLDLVDWVAREPRPYAEVMDAWRTSCPRLTVWEDAVDRGLVERVRNGDGELLVKVTAKGRELVTRSRAAAVKA